MAVPTLVFHEVRTMHGVFLRFQIFPPMRFCFTGCQPKNVRSTLQESCMIVAV